MNSKNFTVANHIVNAVLSHVRNNRDPLIATPFPKVNDNPFSVSAADEPPTPDFHGDTSILHVGLDWGASKTCIKAAFAGSTDLILDECIPTVLGYAKDGIVSGVLPDDATTLFGREALTHRRHLHLAYPTIDSAASADFARHLRARLQIARGAEIRAVIAIPANLDAPARDNLRSSICDHLQSVIFLPQPYLAALGFRDESRLLDPDYTDPARHSIFIDIGASATSLCLVQGYYPTAEEQITIAFGGNHIDELLRATILESHPAAELSSITIRHLKEQHSFVGLAESPVIADVAVAGKICSLDLTNEINFACTELLARIFESQKALVAAAPDDVLPELLQNIIVTGGGSRIRNIAPELERLLTAEGYANPRVQTAGDAYKELAALGALKVARQAREHHWQQVRR